MEAGLGGGILQGDESKHTLQLQPNVAGGRMGTKAPQTAPFAEGGGQRTGPLQAQAPDPIDATRSSQSLPKETGALEQSGSASFTSLGGRNNTATCPETWKA